MDKLILLFLLITFNSFGQNLVIIDSLIKTGQKNFFFVDRTYPGLVYESNYDKCADLSFVKFVLIKASNSDKYEFIKYNNCGQRTSVTTDSEALKFFKANRDQIKRDSIEETVYVDHTVLYSLYEFRDGKIKTRKYFCRECVDLDKEKKTREKNQNLKLYQFFDKLDSELSRLVK